MTHVKDWALECVSDSPPLGSRVWYQWLPLPKSLHAQWPATEPRQLTLEVARGEEALGDT